METPAHGALLEVQGVGVLLLGPSGIGKSECALELVARGHRLVADDVVRLHAEGGRLFGCAPEPIRHYLEIRGLGILYVPDLYGSEAVRDEVEVELVCRLEHWRADGEYERVGLERPRERLAGVELPSLRLPARPAGSLATVVEAAARDHLQRRRGRSAAERLDLGLGAGASAGGARSEAKPSGGRVAPGRPGAGTRSASAGGARSEAKPSGGRVAPGRPRRRDPVEPR